MIPKAENITTLYGVGNELLTVELMVKQWQKSVPQAREIAKSLYTGNMKQDAQNVYNFIKERVQYVNDAPGTEEVRTLARLLSDGKGDCDDMSVSIAAILSAMGYNPVFNVIAQNGNERYSHVFTTVGDFPRTDNIHVQGYAMDPVPPLTRFNQIAPNISKNMKQGLKHYALNGIEGNCNCINGIAGIAAAVSETTQKLIDARDILIMEIQQAGGQSTPAQQKTLRKLTALIKMSDTPEQAQLMGIMGAVDDITLDGYVKLRKDVNLDALDAYLDDIESVAGLGAVKKTAAPLPAPKAPLVNTPKNGGQAIAPKTPAPKTPAPKNKKPIINPVTGKPKTKAGQVISKVLKFMPATLAARNAFLAVVGLNLFNLAVKLSYYFDTRPAFARLQPRRLMLEKMWVDMGGSVPALREAILKGVAKRKNKGGVKGIGEPVTAASVITLATTVIAAVTKILDGQGGKEDLQKSLSEVGIDISDLEAAASEAPAASDAPVTAKDEGFETEANMRTAYDAMQKEPEGGAQSPKPGLYENPLFLIGGAALLIGGVMYANSSSSKRKRK